MHTAPILIRLLATGLLATVSFALAPQSHAQVSLPGTWKPTGPLQTGRQFYTLSPLSTGKFLIAGGVTGTAFLNTAEIYDPHTQTFTASKSLMNIARSQHTATGLPDGTVLITGGLTPQFNGAAIVCNKPGPLPNQLGVGSVATQCAELYDPIADTFTAVGSMNTARESHSATLVDAILYTNSLGTFSPPTPLRVLIAGGDDGSNALSSLEYYDFYLRTFKTLQATLSVARSGQTASWLPTLDRILIAGGHGLTSSPGRTITPLATAEIFDPDVEEVRTVVTMTSARDGHTATVLKSGAVLLAGGASNGSFTAASTAEVFDPASTMFTATGNMTVARVNHAAILMPDGEVLLAGGGGAVSGTIADAETFDPSARLFHGTTPMLNPRANFSLAIDIVANVLAAGGGMPAGPSSLIGRNDSEIYVPFQRKNISPSNICISSAFACQIIRQRAPFILSGLVRHTMVMTPFPKVEPPKKLLNDRKVPVVCRINISGIADNWDVGVFTVDNVPLPFERTGAGDSATLLLTFKDAESFRLAQESSVLVFQMTSKATLEREYPVNVRAELVTRESR